MSWSELSIAIAATVRNNAIWVMPVIVFLLIYLWRRLLLARQISGDLEAKRQKAFQENARLIRKLNQLEVAEMFLDKNFADWKKLANYGDGPALFDRRMWDNRIHPTAGVPAASCATDADATINELYQVIDEIDRNNGLP